MAIAIGEKTLRLYAVTAPGSLLDPTVKARARVWLEAGVRAIQLREKRVKPADLLPLGRYLRAMTSEYGALLIVNDDPYLARVLNADGCHLGQEDMDIAKARQVMGPDKIVGLSTHNREQIEAAAGMDIDYVGVGPVFRSSTKDIGRPLTGPELPGWAATRLDVPVVAIGGIDQDNVGQVVQHGCTNIAVVSALNNTPDPGQSARDLLQILSAPIGGGRS